MKILKKFRQVAPHTHTMSNAQQHLANALFLVNTLKMLKEGGVYVLADTGLQYKREGNKLVCNKKAFKLMTKITGGRASSILKLECIS